MNKYSLRVEIDRALEEKLRRIAATRGVTMTEVIRQEIDGIPETSPLSLSDIRATKPRVFEKLYFWTAKRMLRSLRATSLSQIPEESVLRNMENYLFDILWASSSQSLQEAVSKWDSVLTYQEKAVVTELFFPFRLPYDENVDWFTSSDWYNLQAGEYVVLQEEVVDEISSGGITEGLVTINSYDAKVLNTSRMAIVDVDTKGDSLLPWDSVVTPYESVALAALEAFSEATELSFRVYKTAAGLRYVCTNEEMNPTDTKTQRMMRILYADPKYSNLCSFQETFRARLTPKPWRAYNDDKDYRTCDLIRVVGSGKILSQFKESVDYHDRETGVSESGLYLA